MIVTGHPVEPVTHRRRRHPIAHADRALVTPGIALGVTVARASRISSDMVAAATRTVADLTDTTGPPASLLPPATEPRRIAATVAVAVARAADRDGLAQAPLTDPIDQVHRAMWRPDYPALEIEP